MTLWDSVDALIDRAPTVADVEAQGLGLLAARRWRSLGRDVPGSLVDEERRAAINTLAAPFVLGRVRETLDGELLLFKGPEVARQYPDPALRPFGDVDLLVRDAAAAQRTLLGAGFEPVGPEEKYRDIHHVQPVGLPGMPVVVELHSEPKWLDWLEPPNPDDIFAAAIPSATGIGGILAPSSAQHALLLAVHSWAHVPFRRILDLVDVAAVGSDRLEEIDAIARRWQVERVWTATWSGVETILGQRHASWPLRTWARNITLVRRRTVLENHLERWLSPLASRRGPAAPAAAVRAVAADLRIGSGSVRRIPAAVGNAATPVAEHNRAIADAERRGRR